MAHTFGAGQILTQLTVYTCGILELSQAVNIALSTRGARLQVFRMEQHSLKVQLIR